MPARTRGCQLVFLFLDFTQNKHCYLEIGQKKQNPCPLRAFWLLISKLSQENNTFAIQLVVPLVLFVLLTVCSPEFVEERCKLWPLDLKILPGAMESHLKGTQENSGYKGFVPPHEHPALLSGTPVGSGWCWQIYASDFPLACLVHALSP